MESNMKVGYELVPPDGGWGWMVVLGVALNYVTGQSQVSVFSLVFGDKLISMGHETTSAAIVMNIANAVFSFSGLFTGPLMKTYSTRQVAFAGGVSLATGLMLSSFGNTLAHIVITYGVLVEPLSYWRRLVAFMDLDLLRDGRYLNVAVATASVTMANVNFSLLLPFLLQSHAGLSMADTALCLSVAAAGDLAARLAVPPVVDRLQLRPRLAFFMGVIILAITRSALAASSGLVAMYVWCALCGVGSGVVTVYNNLSIAEVSPEEKLPAAVGLNMLFNGLQSLSLGPLLGYIRDETKDYPLCIHILSLLICATMLSWCVEGAMQRYRRKR